MPVETLGTRVVQRAEQIYWTDTGSCHRRAFKGYNGIDLKRTSSDHISLDHQTTYSSMIPNRLCQMMPLPDKQPTYEATPVLCTCENATLMPP